MPSQDMLAICNPQLEQIMKCCRRKVGSYDISCDLNVGVDKSPDFLTFSFIFYRLSPIGSVSQRVIMIMQFIDSEAHIQL